MKKKTHPSKSLEWKLKIKTLSEANLTGEHWSKKHKRHTSQKMLIRLFFSREKPKIHLPCLIKLTRIAPRSLDSDNLSSAFKWIRDEISSELTGIIRAGMADDDSRIQWQYAQKKGEPKEYAILMEFNQLDDADLFQ